MLEEEKNVIYLSITKEGKIERYMGKNEPAKQYRRVGGFVERIRSQKKKINDNDVVFLQLHLRDDQESISVQVPMYSSAGPDIIRSLAYAMEQNYDFTKDQMVFIEAYSKLKDGKSYTNAAVYFGLTKLDWAQLPNGLSRQEGLEELFKSLDEYIRKLNGGEDRGPAASVKFQSRMNDMGDIPEDVPFFENDK